VLITERHWDVRACLDLHTRSNISISLLLKQQEGLALRLTILVTGRGTARTETPISPDAAPILMSGEHFVIQLPSDIRTRDRDAARRTVARIARNERNSGSCNKGSLGRPREGGKSSDLPAFGERSEAAQCEVHCRAGSSHRVTTT